MHNLKIKIKKSNLKFYLSIFIFAFCILNLTGCATYKFHHGKPPLDKGYVVSRDDYTIVEYTLGENNTVPGIKLAKERFKRRSDIVEDYYKKMGLIQNHFKMAVVDPAVMFLKLIGGIFRLPFIAVSDYRYEHNPKYKEKIDQMERDKEAQEEARVNKLREELHKYVLRDLSIENPNLKQAEVKPQEEPVNPQDIKEEAKIPQEKQLPPKETIKEVASEPAPVAPEPLKQVLPNKVKEEPIPQVKEEPAPEAAIGEQTVTVPEEKKIAQEAQPQIEEEKKEELPELPPQIEKEKTEDRKEVSQDLSADVRAVIIARPQKGYSPLRVKFNAANSRSKFGRIVSYSWDFGDGDTSIKINPVNTFYSTSFEPRYFTVILTVRDIKGNTASAKTTVEVLNK